jgi:hypothetical protein
MNFQYLLTRRAIDIYQLDSDQLLMAKEPIFISTAMLAIFIALVIGNFGLKF